MKKSDINIKSNSFKEIFQLLYEIQNLHGAQNLRLKQAVTSARSFFTNRGLLQHLGFCRRRNMTSNGNQTVTTANDDNNDNTSSSNNSNGDDIPE